MKLPKVSVIVPVYNVSKYIERCIRSLFEQTMEDLEIIFVDDCSPDESIQIIKSTLLDYPARANCVQIYKHDVNKGLPTARETGCLHATGEYIAHCDSDDWVSREMYLSLYSAAQNSNADIVCCDFYKTNGYISKTIKVSEYNGGLLQGPVWNKIVRRDLYKRIKFPKANKAEDGAIMTQLSFFASKIVVTHTPYYYYYENPDSICNIPSKDACINRWRQECENTDFRIAFLSNHSSLEHYKVDVIMMKYYALCNLTPYLNDDDVYNLWLGKYPEIRNDIFKNCKIPVRVKVAYLFMRYRKVKLLGK